MYLGIHQNNPDKDDPELKLKIVDSTNTRIKISPAIVKYKKALSTNLVQVFIDNNRLHIVQQRNQKNFQDIMIAHNLTLIKDIQTKNITETNFIVHVGYVTRIDSNSQDILNQSFNDIFNTYVILGSLKRSLGKRINCFINIHMPNRIDQNIIKLFSKCPKEITMLIENPNNQPLEKYFELYQTLIQGINDEQISNRIYLTLDTAHMFTSGTRISDFLSENKDLFKNILKYIKLIHLNGNSTSFNSKADKHANIFSKEDLVFDSKEQLKEFIKYIQKNAKQCLGFILERNEQTYSQEEFDEIQKMI